MIKSKYLRSMKEGMTIRDIAGFCPEERTFEVESTVCLSGSIVVGIASLGISVKFDAVGEFFFPVN